MAQVSPPKPWETGGRSAPVPSAAPLPPSNMSTATAAPAAPSATASSSSNAPPTVPSRPSALQSSQSSSALAASNAYGSRAGAYGSSYASPYGGYNSYSSPYSRMGGMGGMSGYGMGGYGMGGMGGYGGYGMGGMGGMGGYGQPGMDPNDPNSLIRGMEASTAATFQVIESIVGAVGGFAQMLESTFMATHSSFFAMVAVAEQFGNLRNTLGSVLGIFTMLKYLRLGISKITGRPLPAAPTSLSPAQFQQFQARANRPTPSKKPLLFFLAAIFGLPYLMTKLIRALATAREEHARMLGPPPGAEAVDPANLEFARVKWDYAPQDPAGQGVDLEVKKGDLVAILARMDGWWRCRARDGRVGFLPGEWLEVIVRKGGVGAGREVQVMNEPKSELAKEFAKVNSQGGTMTM